MFSSKCMYFLKKKAVACFEGEGIGSKAYQKSFIQAVNRVGEGIYVNYDMNVFERQKEE